MVVKSRMASPIRQKNGTWKIVVEEFEENIPDLGRHRLMCNKCGTKSYPSCMEWCPIEKSKKTKS